jgi:hypothetical protein
MTKDKRKSHNWSTKEMKQIGVFVDDAIAAGKSKVQGYDDAATHFGVTRNAISIRYGRYLGRIKMSKAKANTVKEATIGKTKTRKPYKKRTGDVTNFLAKHGAIEEVESFSQKQALTKELRRMVIDLMNTSGHIKAVSIDLSNKSFTVIF